ncbi:MAG: imidazolonepropionase [Planctomycetes bacterium]|nr:imidazolonepropionase [Planctomycetota bacterium]MCP4771454.1 imidazolonepropionase [Planctomycetota bacterium]MCP4861115.1 imidazolonepropionase [Planctomycetota bacterium]
MSTKHCQLLIHGAAEVVSWDPQAPTNADSVVVHDGKIAAVGVEQELRKTWQPFGEINAFGGVIAPGFVDGHVHPVFAVGRAEEFDWRAQGVDYLEIAARGGGILSSVRNVREANPEDLFDTVCAHLRRMRHHGTTSMEGKSGYGLSTEDELKSLQILARAGDAVGMEVFPTFLGAHMFPEEYRDNQEAYMDLLCKEMLPAVKEQGIARAADIFIEQGAFNVEQARRYCERAIELGFKLRIHADQFHQIGGVELAVELGAECVDHLEVLSDSGLEAMALSGKTYAGLLPSVPHFLRQKEDAPARKLLQAGVPYFIATDFNPGSSYTPSLPEAAHFGRIRLNLTAAEVMHGVTLGAASSLGIDNRKGHLRPGADADLVVLALPDLFHFGYAFGENPVSQVVCKGDVVRF